MMLLKTILKAEELLERAHSAGITLELGDGQVCMRRPASAPKKLLAELRSHRDAVVAVLDRPVPTVEQELTRDAKGWVIEDHAIGACVVCDGPCRSWDSENRPRHLMCKIGAER